MSGDRRVQGLEAELRIVLERERKLLEQTDTLERELRDARSILARIITLPRGTSEDECLWCDGSGTVHASEHARDCMLFIAWQHQARASLAVNFPEGHTDTCEVCRNQRGEP